MQNKVISSFLSNGNFTLKNSLKGRNNIMDMLTIKKFLETLALLLIIFTILFFTCFGCFVVLNDSTSWKAQTVNLSNEGQLSHTDHNSMGEYQLKEDGYNLGKSVYWYRHLDRDDRFLMYNNLDNFFFI